MPQASVLRVGNSVAVSLPRSFREENGIEAGDKVEVEYPAQGVMVIRPLRKPAEERLAAFREMCELADAHGAEGPSGDRGSVRDALEGRYA